MKTKHQVDNKFIDFIKTKAFLLFTGFLLVFIPLYPKLPFFDIIPGYLVRVRLEDFLVAFTVLWFLFKIIKEKISLKANPLFLFVLIYCLIGFISLLVAMFILGSIPLELLHIGKSAMHFFRYIEYFSLLFITAISIKEKKDVVILLSLLGITLFGVIFYGYGQKYWYWPVYSTMNREFSKGMRLYLTEHARVQSTFGGHYDLAAYLVIILSSTYAFAINIKKPRILKIILHLVHLFGLWLIVVSASRTSFIAYLAAIGINILFTALFEKKLKDKIFKFFKLALIYSLLLFVMMASFGQDMQERLTQVLNGYPQLLKTYHHVNDWRKKATHDTLAFFGLREPRKPSDGLSTEDAAKMLVSSDEVPVAERPLDVYADIPVPVQVATVSATGETTVITVEASRTWSECALTHSLSLCIRLDELWPNAINGFLRNPLTGKGYATLNKKFDYHFVEADSTDNNYLRVLGETGSLGFISFFSIPLIGLVISFYFIKSQDQLTKIFSLAYFASTVGLLANAVYIDVFAASKVAFTYWAITGIYIGLLLLDSNNKFLKKLKIVKLVNNVQNKILPKFIK